MRQFVVQALACPEAHRSKDVSSDRLKPELQTANDCRNSFDFCFLSEILGAE
jgi:hypothetical protein